MRSRMTRLARLAVPVLLGGLLLSGCGDASPGTAARVGDARLTVAEVQERTAAFLEAYPEARSSGVTPDQVSAITVENFIRAQIVDATAADLGIEPTQTELDEFVESLGGIEEVTRRTSSAGVPPDPELVAIEIRSGYLQFEIGRVRAGEGASDDDVQIASREATDAMAAALEIEVNPRYGTWDGGVVGAADGSLSIPVEEFGVTETPAPLPEG